MVSPVRGYRLRAITRLQAAFRGCAARRCAAQLRLQKAAVAAMHAALCSGSRIQVEAASANLRDAGT